MENIAEDNPRILATRPSYNDLLKSYPFSKPYEEKNIIQVPGLFE
jgi:hypothetical protein